MTETQQYTQTLPDGLSREQLAAMLSQAPADRLIALADAVLDSLDEPSQLRVTRPPQVGTVVIQVREPLARQRFILADALACNVEVALRGQAGWAMRLGDNIHATTAAAICEAEFVAGGPRAGEVRALAEQVRHDQAQNRADEWSRLAATIVEFEEIP